MLSNRRERRYARTAGRRGPGAHLTEKKVRVKNAPKILLRILGYLKDMRLFFIIAICLIFIATALQMAGPYIQGYAIDNALIPGDMQKLLRLALMLFAVYFALSIITFVQERIMVNVSQNLVRGIRRDLFSHIHKLSLRYIDEKSQGEMISRVTNDVETINQTLSAAVSQFFSGALMLVSVVVMMFVVNVWLALISIAMTPIIILITRVIASKTRKGFSKRQEKLGNINSIVEETVSGLRVLKLFSREEKEMSNFEKENDELKRASIYAQILFGIMGPFMNLLRNINYAVVAFFGGLFVIKGHASIGVIAIFLQYTRQFSQPINQLAQMYNMIQSALAGAERVFEVMDEENEIKDSENAKDFENIEGDVRFDSVSFSYVKGQPVLKNVTFSAKKGEMIALVGPTGAGKTTIVNLLTRFYDTDKGTIYVDESDIKTLPLLYLRKKMGIVLQDSYLFSDTIFENIRYGNLKASDEEVIAAAKLANADHFIKHLHGGYNAHISENGSNLSLGQRQLIAIARTILSDPSILILDEATSSVDTRTEVHVQQAMLNLMKGRTSFVIAHRLSTIKSADRILVIKGGEIVEEGSHNELLNAQGVYSDMWRSVRA